MQRCKQGLKGLVRSQYTPNPQDLKSFIETYGLDIWILDRDFTSPRYLDQQPWLLNSSMRPTVKAAQAQLQQNIQPAIISTIPSCSTFESANLIVLDAQCIARTAIESN